MRLEMYGSSDVVFSYRRVILGRCAVEVTQPRFVSSLDEMFNNKASEPITAQYSSLCQQYIFPAHYPLFPIQIRRWSFPMGNEGVEYKVDCVVARTFCSNYADSSAAKSLEISTTC